MNSEKRPQKAWTQAWSWYKGGWILFSKNRGTWILFAALWGLGTLLLWQVPALGLIAWWVLNPALYAGFIYEAAEISQGRGLMLEHLFLGLTDGTKRMPLLTLGVITLAGYGFLSIMTTLGPSLTSIGDLLSQSGEGAKAGVVAILINYFLWIMNISLVVTLVAMALLYSCPSIMLEQGREAFESMMHSIETCMDHWRPFGAFVLIFLGLGLVALLPVGLGFLVLMPVTSCAAYVSYESLRQGAQPL